jgi:hypothetical protein
VLDREAGEDEPTDVLPPSLSETEEVDDPGYLGGACDGTITVNPPSGYQGDPAVYTIVIKPPFDREIVRVTTDNPACRNCDAKQVTPGKHTLTLHFTGKGPFTATFLAFDKDGKVRCSGSTGSLRSLGPKPR